MYPESYLIEYKRELPKTPDKLEKEVVSFLNSDGGKIYFGIENDGTVIGTEKPDELQLKIKDRIKNNIAPEAWDYCSLTIEKRKEKYLVVLTINKGSKKPYYLTKYGMTVKGCYLRIGSAIEPMSVRQIEQQFSRRVRNSLKNIPSPHCDLTFNQLHLYYESRQKILNDKFMENLDLLTDKGVPNYSAYLLADENRNAVLFAKYSGKTRVNLIKNELCGDYCLIKSFERLIDKIEAENSIFAKITPKRRIECKSLNSRALREAILNALIHNDYANGAAPKVEVFSDRVEITSYGGLPYGVSEHDFFSGISIQRNPELMRVFHDLEFVEQLGSGVPRIIEAYSKDVFEIEENYIRVTIPFATKDDIDRCMITTLIKDNPTVTISEISQQLEISESQIKTILEKLKANGKLIREGAKKNGKWVFIT